MSAAVSSYVTTLDKPKRRQGTAVQVTSVSFDPRKQQESQKFVPAPYQDVRCRLLNRATLKRGAVHGTRLAYSTCRLAR